MGQDRRHQHSSDEEQAEPVSDRQKPSLTNDPDVHGGFSGD
jgi:hypothetical protein